jgi:hypothetical protein
VKPIKLLIGFADLKSFFQVQIPQVEAIRAQVLVRTVMLLLLNLKNKSYEILSHTTIRRSLYFRLGPPQDARDTRVSHPAPAAR